MWFNQKKTRSKPRRNGFRGVTLRAKASGSSKTPFLRKLFCACILLVVALGSCALAWMGIQWLSHELMSDNALFRLHEIKVDIIGTALTREKVVEYASLENCGNVFAFDIERTRRNFLREVPQARSISISRQLPGTLLLNVVERLPLARISSGSSAYLTVDREGMVLASVVSRQAPIITGHGVRPIMPGLSLATSHVMNAVAFLDLCETTSWIDKIRVASVDVSRKNKLQLTLAGGERVDFAWNGMGDNGKQSRENLEVKIAKLSEILKDTAARGRSFEYADLTLEQNIPVTYKK